MCASLLQLCVEPYTRHNSPVGKAYVVCPVGAIDGGRVGVSGAGLSEVEDSFGNTVYSFFDFLHAQGVGEAEVARCTEGLAWDRGHVGPLQEVGGQIHICAEEVPRGGYFAQKLGDTWENVEGTPGGMDLKALQAGELLDDKVAAVLELGPHLADGGLIPRERLQGCHLGDRGGV